MQIFRKIGSKKCFASRADRHLVTPHAGNRFITVGPLEDFLVEILPPARG
jgi:hypothetical protein